MTDKINIVIKFDKLCEEATTVSLDEIKDDFNDTEPLFDNDVYEYARKNTDNYLEHYISVLRKNLHSLVQNDVKRQINE
ncbi:hypothetical protein P3U10_04340 [Mammaliicoccus sciuri]|uniref:hypothetical protein n=1 Tax=Mammaliicoccus sciuri TaxID=1296 RepID=UPI002B2567CA|nr:hypothetical protein [Mammaliicoccus sciuri]WQK61412.1 hypothetical protein P3U10_04340 [Mammaliicoccus sciuri]